MSTMEPVGQAPKQDSSTSLTRVLPEDMSDGDLAWLAKVCGVSYTGVTPEGLLPELVAGTLAMWRVNGGAAGVVLTQILQHPGGRELYMWGMAGKGIIENIETIYDGLKAYGASQGCRWVGGRALRPGLTRVYEKLLGVRPFAAHFVKEI